MLRWAPHVTVLLGLSVALCQYLPSPTVTRPCSFAVADFNGDGRPDLASACPDQRGVSILLNDGAGSLAAPMPLAADLQTASIAAGDLDGDGIADLVLGSPTKLSVWLGTSDGSFRPGPEYPVASAPAAIAAGDFNGDGRLDLAVAASSGNSVQLWLGQGEGRLRAGDSVATGLSPIALVTGDFDGDGRADLAVANAASQSISILLGRGDGRFQDAVHYPAGNTPRALVAADFNRDGHIDLAVANFGGHNVSILLGSDHGAFLPAADYDAGDGPWQLAAADFDGDGKLDLAVADLAGGPLTLLPGNGNGTFQPKRRMPFSANALTAADFDGDGIPDLMTATPSTRRYALLAGTGKGNFRERALSVLPRPPGPIVTLATSANPSVLGSLVTLTATVTPNTATGTVTFYDNGVPLGIAPVSSGTAVFSTRLLPWGARTLSAHYRGNAASASSANVPQTVQAKPSSAMQAANRYLTGYGYLVAVGDFNGDGKPDLVAAGGGTRTVYVVLGNGDGTYGSPVNSTVTADPFSIAVGDFNGDGKQDIATLIGFNISVLLGNGDGSFQAQTDLAAGANPSAIVTGDFNGDGFTDLAVSDFDNANVHVRLGNGNGTFQAAIDSPAGAGPRSLAAADLNNDGFTDLMVVSASGAGSLLLSNGDGSFGAPSSNTVDSSYSVVLGDFNGDGRLDAAFACLDGQVRVLLRNANGTFASQVAYPTGGNGLASIAVGDFNGDGIADLVASNAFSGGSDLRLLYGNGNGTFGPAVTYAAGNSPTALAVADLNGDGRSDLVAAAFSVLVFLGGGFQPPVDYPGGDFGFGVVTADFNGDGKLDIAVANEGSDSVSVRPGNGDGSFQAALTLNITGCGPIALAQGDFNGDGIPDLAIACQNAANGLSVALGNGDGTFQTPVPFATGAFVSWIVAGDFNADGKVDVALTSRATGAVSVLLGNGNGTFQPYQNYSAGAQPFAVVVGDFNSDGKPDLAVANKGDNNVSILLGNGAGAFASPVNYQVGTAPKSISLGHFALARRDDLVVACQDGLYVLLGNANGTFQTAVNNPTSGAATTVAAGDLNGDGKDDLIAGVNFVSSEVIQVRMGNGNGTFGPPANYPATSVSDAMAVADLNGDGYPDLVVGRNSGGAGFSVLLGSWPATVSLAVTANPITLGQTVTLTATIPVNTFTGKVTFFDGQSVLGTRTIAAGTASLTTNLLPSGKRSLSAYYSGDGFLVPARSGPVRRTVSSKPSTGYQPPVNYNTGTQSRPVVVGDFDGNGTPDLAVGNNTTSLSVLRGTGGGAFLTAVPHAAGTNQYSMAVGDFDGDGRQDLAVANLTSNNVSVLIGDGNTGFASPVNYTASNPTGVTVADLNGDGIPDLAVSALGNGALVLLGNGDGTFQTGVGYPVFGLPYGIVAADFNGDGIVDLATTDFLFGEISVILGRGNGTFLPAVAFPVGGNPISLATGDFNNDGIPDLAVANQGTFDVSILLGTGFGTFRPAVPYSIGANPLAVAVGDINGDGKIDVAVAKGSGGAIVIFGNGDGTFQPGVTYDAGTGPDGIALADLNGDGMMDLAIANNTSGNVSIVMGGGNAALSVTSSHRGNFSQGQNNAAYTLTVTNGVGLMPTNGAVTVTETLPSGLSLAGMGGIGWICTANTCSRGDVLAGGASYPPITVYVNVASNAASPQVNHAAVTITGGTGGSVNDSTTILAPFTDITNSDFFFNAVNLMREYGITAGCGNGTTYCPNDSVTRAQMAIFIVRSILGGDTFTYSPTPYFNDVPANTFGFQWIQKMWELGITAGCGNNNYCPNDNVTRGQMAIFMIRARLGAAADNTFTYPSTPYFTDVPANYFSYKWVQRMRLELITGGCGNGSTYCPNDFVTRGQMAIFIMRGAFNLLLSGAPPVVSAISPASIPVGQTTQVTISGFNTSFAQGTSVVDLGPGITAGAVTVINQTTLTVPLTVAANASGIVRTVLVTTGAEQAVLPNGLRLITP